MPLDASGVVLLRGALPWWTLWSCHRIFRRFVGDLSGKPRLPAWHSGYENILAKDDWPDTKGDDAETDIGSAHMPWVVRDYNRSPAAMVIAALLKSWTWPVVEGLCKSSDIAILLRFCVVFLLAWTFPLLSHSVFLKTNNGRGSIRSWSPLWRRRPAGMGRKL